MPRALLFSLPEHAALHVALREAGLEHVAWAVLGGVPAHYAALRDKLLKCRASSSSEKDFGRSVEAYVREELRGAITRRAALLVAHPSMAPILDEFLTANEVPEELLTSRMIPSPNTVLRTVASSSGETIYVPADAAMALVLRHRLVTPPPIAELRITCASPAGR
jgi:hypothetical protein